MILTDLQAWEMFDEYTEFIQSLTWYRMYCVGKLGKSKSDYFKSFESLKDKYETLGYFAITNKTEWKDYVVDKFFEKIEAVFRVKRFGQEQIEKIGNLLWEFETKEEREFRNRFFDHRLALYAGDSHSKGLYNAVSELVRTEEYDAALITAFKYLDNYLQTILNVSAHEYFGEKLVNYAFAPNTGKLQLGTSESEQLGIRNFFSGAYGMFRNPSAHRFTNHDTFFAQTVIAMVAVMIQISERLNEMNNRKL